MCISSVVKLIFKKVSFKRENHVRYASLEKLFLLVCDVIAFTCGN